MATNRSVDRALDILYLVSSHSACGLTFSEISRQMSIAKSSLFPLMVSLVDKNFLFFNVEKKKYFLGEAIFNLGNRFAANADILSAIEKIMTEAVDLTGYASFFGVMSGNEVRYLLRKAAKSQTESAALPKYSLNATCTGIGKAMLFDKSLDELKSMLAEGIPRITPHTITSVQTLYNQLSIMRENDIAYEKEESSIGIQCRATPIRYKGKIIAAVSISFPTWIDGTNDLMKIQKTLLAEREKIEILIAANPGKWVFSSL